MGIYIEAATREETNYTFTIDKLIPHRDNNTYRTNKITLHKGTSRMAYTLPSAQTTLPVYAGTGFTKYDRVGALCKQLGIFASQAEYLIDLHFHISTLTLMIKTYYLQWSETPPMNDIELGDRAKSLLRLIVFGRSLQLQWYAVHPALRVAWTEGWFSFMQLSQWITGLGENAGIGMMVLRDGDSSPGSGTVSVNRS